MESECIPEPSPAAVQSPRDRGPMTSVQPLRLCVAGPMIGRNPGYVTTQGEILSDCLARSEHSVVSVSSSRNRYRRLIEIAMTIVRRHRDLDLLIVQVYGGRSFLVEDVASFLAVWFELPVIMHVHGGAMPDFIARFPAWSRRVLRRADALVAPSSYLADVLGRMGFQVTVVPNIVDVERYPFRLRRALRPRLFWMRSFHPLYNPLMALRVLERVRQELPDATLVMAGQEKGMLQPLAEEAVRRKLSSAVRFAGFLDHEGKLREGSAADIFINTNRIDNAPVALLEAGAMGLPVVSTDVGGVGQLLCHGETGLLVADDDTEAMAQAVLRLVGDQALAAKLSGAGRRLAEHSSWRDVGPQWDQVIAAVVQRPTRPPGSR